MGSTLPNRLYSIGAWALVLDVSHAHKSLPVRVQLRVRPAEEVCRTPVDPAGIASVRCAARMADGVAPPVCWFCDVVQLRIDERAERKVYSFSGGVSVVFREDVVGHAHILRLAFLQPEVVCDQVLKDACMAADLKGIVFKDAVKR
jgi:hypothetical protein